jgi:hypothetical protein
MDSGVRRNDGLGRRVNINAVILTKVSIHRDVHQGFRRSPE